MLSALTSLALVAGVAAHMSLVVPGPARNAVDRANSTWKT